MTEKEPWWYEDNEAWAGFVERAKKDLPSVLVPASPPVSAGVGAPSPAPSPVISAPVAAGSAGTPQQADTMAELITAFARGIRNAETPPASRPAQTRTPSAAELREQRKRSFWGVE